MKRLLKSRWVSSTGSRILIIEGIGFLLAIASVWITEAFDPPFSLQQVVIVSLAIGIVGSLAMLLTRRLQAALAQRTKDLERSNQDLQQFAYVASHDMREPLRTVTGFVQLLEQRYRGKLDAKADEYIRFAVDGAERMNQFISGLLVYSRVDSQGKTFEDVDCNVALRQVLENLQASISQSGAVVDSDPLPTLQGDPTQLAQLFQNLIANAVKFRDDRPPIVHVSARRLGAEWEFSVRDNGIGIDPAQAGRLFMMFQRLHDQSKYPGTGIGLATCKKIVERHGGRIWVKSRPGAGSTFFFTISTKPQS